MKKVIQALATRITYPEAGQVIIAVADQDRTGASDRLVEVCHHLNMVEVDVAKFVPVNIEEATR